MINKALTITGLLRLVKLSYLVCCSCFYALQLVYPTQDSSFLLLSMANFLKKHSQIAIIKRDRLQIFFKIDVLKNYTIFTEKHLCWCLFKIKVQPSRYSTLFKRNSNTAVFLQIQRNSSEQLFYETPPLAASA